MKKYIKPSSEYMELFMAGCLMESPSPMDKPTPGEDPELAPRRRLF